MNKNKFFIYAGPPKTASTWLYSVLDKHPEVEMPLLKELRYFFLLEEAGDVSLHNRLFGRQYILRSHRQYFWWKNFTIRLKSLLKGEPESWTYFRFFLHYFFSDWNDEWYQNLFSSNKCSGDISPNYCSLSEKTIQRIKMLNPSTKVIIGLRDPIDKKWSGAKMKLVRMKGKNNIDEVDKKDLEKEIHYQNPNYLDYTMLIQKWEKYFNKNQILIYYYDELKENPQQLYNKICVFLEIEPMKLEGIEKVVNKGKIDEIPVAYKKILIELNYKYIVKFAENYPNKYTLAWVDKYKDFE